MSPSLNFFEEMALNFGMICRHHANHTFPGRLNFGKRVVSFYDGKMMNQPEHLKWKELCLSRLYFTHLDECKRNVVAVTSKYAITFQHGPAHSQLTKGQEIPLMSATSILGPDGSAVPERTIIAIVRTANPSTKLVIFEAKNEGFYPEGSHVLGRCSRGLEYMMLAMVDEVEIVRLGGIFSSNYDEFGRMVGGASRPPPPEECSGGVLCNRKGEVVGMVMKVEKVPISEGSSDQRTVLHFIAAEAIASALRGHFGAKIEMAWEEKEFEE